MKSNNISNPASVQFLVLVDRLLQRAGRFIERAACRLATSVTCCYIT